MSNQIAQTKQGAASLFIVIFTATLLGIIALSFVRLMLSESFRTTNYSLSQSAYNSAMAGIEDAKIVLLRYQNCLNNDNIIPATAGYNCSDYVDAFKDDKSAEDCDLVSRLLGYNTDNNETLIQTQSGGDITDTGKAIDQAYTCVKVSQKSKNYITKLTKNYQTKIVPIRTSDSAEIQSINRVVVSWFSRDNYIAVTNAAGTLSSDYEALSSPLPNLITPNQGYANGGGTYNNRFGAKPAVPPTVQATLIQTAEKFRVSQFYTNSGANTNRATVTMRPTGNTLGLSINSYSTRVSGLAATANKSFNNPVDIYCDTSDGWGNGYACTADLVIPNPIPTQVQETLQTPWGTPYNTTVTYSARNINTMFLVLNLPYGAPDTEVNVELKHCEDEGSDVFDTDKCTSVYFSKVQPIVDATGRANDLFRRIEARIETQDTYFPIANYALAVYDPDNSNSGIYKNFYATSRCYNSTYLMQDGIPTLSATDCPDVAGETGE